MKHYIHHLLIFARLVIVFSKSHMEREMVWKYDPSEMIDSKAMAMLFA